MRDTDLFLSTEKLVRDTDLSGMEKLVRAVESFSNVERPMLKGKRNRELQSVQRDQMEKEKILSEQKSLPLWSLRCYDKIVFSNLRNGSYFKIWFLN